MMINSASSPTISGQAIRPIKSIIFGRNFHGCADNSKASTTKEHEHNNEVQF